MSVLMTSALLTLVIVSFRFAARLSPACDAELIDGGLLAAEGVDDLDRTQALLRERQHGAFLFLDGRGLLPDAAGKMLDRPRPPPGTMPTESSVSSQSMPQHDDEDAHQRDARGEDVREPPVVDRLDALRIVGHAERRIAGAAGVVELQRQALEIGEQVGAQLQQRLQAHPHEKKIAPQAQQPEASVTTTRNAHSANTCCARDRAGVAATHPPHRATGSGCVGRI